MNTFTKSVSKKIKAKTKKAVKWITVFNAKRDNNGVGIEMGEFLKILRSIPKK